MQIRLKVRGVRAELDREGVLRAGPIRHWKPVAYQERGGRRLPVEVWLEERSEGEFALATGAYDRTLPLVIDPVVEAVRINGGQGEDRTVGAGPAYRYGTTASGDWSRLQTNGSRDVFVEFDAHNGSTLTCFWGGTGDEQVGGAVFDPVNGQVLIVGATTSRDAVGPQSVIFGKEMGSFAGGASDGFVLSVQYGVLVGVRLIGGPGDDRLEDIQTWPGEHFGSGLLIVGETTDARWGSAPVTQVGTGGGTDGVVVHLVNSKLASMTVIGGSGSDRARRLARRGLKSWVIAGETDSPDFPSGQGAQPVSSQGQDLWAGVWEELDQTPERLVLFGGPGRESIAGLGLWERYGLILAGSTDSRDLPGQVALAPGGASDWFLTRLHPSTLAVETTIYLGGAGRDELHGFALSNGDIHLAGATDSVELGLPAVETAGDGGGIDGLYVLLDHTFRPVRASRWGGSGTDRLLGVFPEPPEELPREISGASRVRLAGTTENPSWLQSLDPRLEVGGGEDGFSLIYAFQHFVVLSEPGLVVGQGLQTKLYLRALTFPGPGEAAGNGLIRVRSTDPERVRLAREWDEPGQAEVVLWNADGPNGGTVVVQAWGEPGEVLLEITGTGAPGGIGLPDQRHLVRVAPAALFRTSPGQVITSISEGFALSLAYAPVMADGRPGEAQIARPGINPTVSYRASDPTALLSPREARMPTSNPHISDIVRFSRDGEYTLGFETTGIPAAPGQEVRVAIRNNRSLAALRDCQIAKDSEVDIFLQLAAGESLTLRSTDASIVRLRAAAPQGQSPAAYEESVTMTANGSVQFGVFAAGGRTRIEVTGFIGGERVEQSFFVYSIPYRAILSAAASVPAGLPFMVSLGRTVLAPQVNDGIPILSGRWLVEFPSKVELTSTNPEVAVLSHLNWTSVSFSAIRPGTTTIRVVRPALEELAAASAQVEVQPLSIRTPREDIWIAAGTARMTGGFWTNNTGAYGNIAQLRVRLSEGSPFLLRHFDQVGTDLTFDYTSQSGWPYLIARDAKPGQTSTLYLSAPGTAEAAIKIHAVELIWEPSAAVVQTSLDQKGELFYLASGLINGNPIRLPDAEVLMENPPSFDVRVEPAGICEFGPPSAPDQLGRLRLGFTCAQEGVVKVLLRPVGGQSNWQPSLVKVVAQRREGAVQLPRRFLTGQGVQSVCYPNSLDPERRLILRKATSLDPERLKLSLSYNRAGQESVAPAQWQTIFLQGYAQSGAARLRFDFENGTSREVAVYLLPVTLALRADNSFSSKRGEVISPLSQKELKAEAIPMLVEPETGRVIPEVRVTIRGGTDPFFAKVTSSDEALVRPERSDVLFEEGKQAVDLGVRLVGPGQAVLSLSQPPGFATTPDAALRVRVVEQRLELAEPPVLARNLQRQSYLRLWNDGPSELTVTSLDPEKLLVSSGPTQPGQERVTVQDRQFNLQAQPAAMPGSTARIRLEAPGFTATEQDVLFLEAGFEPVRHVGSLWPGSLNELRLRFGPLDPGTGNVVAEAGLRPGLTHTLRVVASDPSVVQVLDGSVPIAGATTIRLQTLRPGSFHLLFSAPSEFRLVEDRLNLLVSPYYFSSSSPDPAGSFLSTAFTISNPRNIPTPVTVSNEIGVPLRFGTAPSGPQGPSTSSLTVELKPRESRTLFLEPVASGTSSAIKLSAPETENSTTHVSIGNPMLSFPLAGPLVAEQTMGTLEVAIQVGLEWSSSRQPVLGASAGTLKLSLKSSNPAVIRAPQAPVELAPGQSRVLFPVQLVGKGEAILSFDAPPGFNGLAKTRNLVIQVR